MKLFVVSESTKSSVNEKLVRLAQSLGVGDPDLMTVSQLAGRDVEGAAVLWSPIHMNENGRRVAKEVTRRGAKCSIVIDQIATHSGWATARAMLTAGSALAPRAEPAKQTPPKKDTWEAIALENERELEIARASAADFASRFEQARKDAETRQAELTESMRVRQELEIANHAKANELEVLHANIAERIAETDRLSLANDEQRKTLETLRAELDRAKRAAADSKLTESRAIQQKRELSDELLRVQREADEEIAKLKARVSELSAPPATTVVLRDEQAPVSDGVLRKMIEISILDTLGASASSMSTEQLRKAVGRDCDLPWNRDEIAKSIHDLSISGRIIATRHGNRVEYHRADAPPAARQPRLSIAPRVTVKPEALAARGLAPNQQPATDVFENVEALVKAGLMTDAEAFGVMRKAKAR